MHRPWGRLQGDDGYTLIEMVIVLEILGILMAVAVPSYLGLKERANQTAAAADVRGAVGTAEAWYSDYGTYSGMTVSKMVVYDQAVKIDSVVLTDSGFTYCLQKTVSGKMAHVTRGAGALNSANVVEGSLCA